jgi:hypothetical protein
VFEELLAQFPDYVPTYLMAGGTLISLGRKDEAAEVYRKGIEVAQRRGDQYRRSAHSISRREPPSRVA